MKTTARRILVLGMLAALSLSAWAAKVARDPYVGYAFPAGGRQGTTVPVIVGGQYLQGAKEVFCTGTGVQATVVDYGRALSKKQLGDVGQHLRILIRQKWAELLRPQAALSPAQIAEQRQALDPLPDHPLLRDLEQKSLEDLEALRDRLFDPKRQPNAQIGEEVWLKVTIDPQAAPGDRELRLRTTNGLTNPVRFQVSNLPEVVEPNRKSPTPPPPLAVPVVLNGQVLPGQVDQFRLALKAGQKLVCTTQARKLIPYLADAVPGWFQATLTLRDAAGQEVAFADDYRNDPDPVLRYAVPRDGEYSLAINDAIYRGREDFVYRLTVGEQPFITSLFPLGGKLGNATTVSVTGWNLPFKAVKLDTSGEECVVRQSAWPTGTGTTNPISYRVDDLPESLEIEPNETGQQGQKLTLPRSVDGRIGKPGDVDVFRLEGKAGEELVAEVFARRLGSPLDSQLRLINAAGKVIATNDDHEDKELGLITDQADSYLRVVLPGTGEYYLQLVDAQQHGGEEYAYRLCVGPPRPDFALRVTPSSLEVPATRITPLTVHVLRKDGFSGAVDLRLKNAPPGFMLSGGHIPAGVDKLSLTLAMPGEKLSQPLALQLEGTATIGTKTITHPAVPAEDMMQAFAYRSLVPMQVLMVGGGGFGRWTPDMTVAGDLPLKLPAGGTVVARIALARPLPPNLKLKMQLAEGPAGVTLESQKQDAGAITLTLKAEAKTTPGLADNVIAEAFTEVEVKRPDGKPANRQPLTVGVLPAIPIEIVKP